jgi:hypothetical protein
MSKLGVLLHLSCWMENIEGCSGCGKAVDTVGGFGLLEWMLLLLLLVVIWAQRKEWKFY